VTDTLQLEEAIQLHDAPKLLVEWSSPWQEFVTSIRPAFARSGARLAGEAPHGLFPYRSLLASLLLEAFLLFVVAVLPGQIARLRPYSPPKLQPYEVIYYSGDELPRTEDLGGAQAGASGRAGGQEAHHRTQTIHVARGGSLAPRVVDAPDLKLPASSGAVANLLAMKPNPGPPPAEGLHSSLIAPRLPSNVITPAPANITRDQSRGGLTLDAIVAPAPSISSGQYRAAPALNAAVVPPAPNVRSEHTLVAPRLDSGIIAPAPNVSRDRTLPAPSLNSNVIAPPSTRLSRDQERSTPDLNSSVVPPAPAAVNHEVAPSRVQMNDVAVVPPPVSAPERETSRNSKLNLPAPSVIAPPPSADSARDLRRLESGSAVNSSPTVVPPPPAQANSGWFASNIIGKLFGTQEVVPPPPTVSSGTARNATGGPGGSLATSVVPPPPSIAGSSAAPGGSASARAQGSSLGASNIIPPPPSVAGSGTSRNSSTSAGNSGGSSPGTILASVVPPPPTIGATSGRKGSGLGDAGSVLAPPKGESGTGGGAGVVISSQPGSKVAIPGSGKGSLALSPSGGEKLGLGDSGGGASIGHGDGPGSGLTGAGAGDGRAGTGHSSDPNASVHGGISPTPGPGGAGSAPTGSPAVPGVDIRGGSTVVTLPSFGSDGNSAPNLPERSSVKQQPGPAITIVATSSSGGGFDFYGKLPGDNYTVYVETAAGTVVMQYAEADPASRHQAGTLLGPQALRTDLPADLPHARVVVKCRLDASGNLRNLQVLEPGPAGMTARIIAALPSWKFRPAMRGAQTVEVNAILGFNIDTNDRN
jgi:hypothetical protein